MSSLINSAISGIRLNQLALAVTGNNIVNANTEGYSRQSINQATNISIKTGAGYLGTGVQVLDIFRNTEQFMIDQVVKDTSTLSEFDAYLFNISQTNNLLAADQTNLARYMNDYFSAMNVAVNDPASPLGRQLLLTQSQQMVTGFKAIASRLTDQNVAVNKQLEAVASKVTTIGAQIAKLNQAIADAFGGSGGKNPNDLLDQRDQMVRELAGYININTVSRPDGSLDIFIGQGQPLVVGQQTNTLKAVPGALNSSRFDLVLQAVNGTQVVTKQMNGGEIGGLLRFRNEALEPALNSLGLIAMGLVDGINRQNQLGMDLEGSLGGVVFTDINSPAYTRERITSSRNNLPPNDALMSVRIDSVSNLTTSDYELVFTGPGNRQYSLLRLSDGAVVDKGLLTESMPQTISADGFSIRIESGSFNPGDRFSIKPTKSGVSQMEMRLTRPEEFAFASPLRIEPSAANQGGAQVLGSQVVDGKTEFFSLPGQLQPPLLIRFTSATTYDVLDYSDPARPVPLNPPMTNMSFVLGVQNFVFPTDAGGTTVSSAGPATAVLQLGSTLNGYPGETVTIRTTDPVTGFYNDQTVTLDANATASEMATRLSAINGVNARAYTVTQLSDFQPGLSSDPLRLSLNGIDLTDPALVLAGETLPQVIPDPLTPDFLRDRINNNPALKAQGIYARSDGVTLSVHATTGIDLNFIVSGDGSFVAGDNNDLITAPTPPDPDLEFTVGGRLEVQLAADVELTSNITGGVFGTAPPAIGNYLGIQLSIISGNGADGQARAGDSFVVAYNKNGTADSRNGLEMAALISKGVLAGGTLSFQDAYGQLAEQLGILTSQARVNQTASESLLRQSLGALQSLAGVNLEEEAARLIQLEQHYNASARLIALARDLFDTLLAL